MSKKKISICKECGENVARNDICGKCNYRKKRHTKVKSKCKQCGKEVEFSISRIAYFNKRGGKLCSSCVKKRQSSFMTDMNSKRTHEELAEMARKGNRNETTETRSNAAKKMWKRIRKDPEKIKKICEQRSTIAKQAWKNYDDEKKNKILKKWLNPSGRSKLNEKFKKEMKKNGIYEGFVSEDPFCGFIPDEVNHDLKIIVEIYGDYWHCNPRIYDDPDRFFKKQNKTAAERWEYDRRRLGAFYDRGYTVIIVWENDIKKDMFCQIERIKDEINKKKKIRRKL